MDISKQFEAVCQAQRHQAHSLPGTYIKEMREAAGITIAEAARKSGLNWVYWERLESHVLRDLNVGTLRRVASALPYVSSLDLFRKFLGAMIKREEECTAETHSVAQDGPHAS